MGWRLFNAIVAHRAASIESPATSPTTSTSATGGQPSTSPGPAAPTPGTVTLSPAACTIYAHQAAALDKDQSAQNEATRLRARGYSAYVTYLPSSPPVYKVRVGAFADKATASAYSASLKKAGVSGFLSSVSIPATQRTWRGSDATYLAALKKAAEEAGALVPAEAGWFDAYHQKKIDREALKTRADQWKERLRAAGAGLTAAAPADLTALGSRVTEAQKAAEGAVEALSTFAGSGTNDAYGRAVAAYMKLVDAYRAVLAWDGNK